ncbi:cardiolipin synthase (CMP-forming), mitochondrial-like isoform X3 [Asparagus officinalis]|uniref:cardiolipin synthase (CMP-forming), mitochondrial-like isoform X3 n=1 Tax=Asparagus officinalis TaxID=4686 RepID=UPI00098E269F|nr:cardiolipin synthase (CMP-forming), mitochondrial-like isoform X3 [Asparagus officinalis]
MGGDRIQSEVNGSCKGGGEGERRSKLLTLPTVLTLGRVAAVPLLVSTFYMNNSWATSATTSIFIAAAVTDWLDGYIARKMQIVTPFGAFLDPVADKLMVAATLVMLCTKPLEAAIFEGVPWLLTVPSIAIIGREITMSAVREWAASQNTKVLKSLGSRRSACFGCNPALHFRWPFSMVLSCVRAKYLENLAEIAPYGLRFPL